jgi:hypothetical protein
MPTRLSYVRATSIKFNFKVDLDKESSQKNLKLNQYIELTIISKFLYSF